MEARFPELEESPESAEGTAAHWCFAQILAGILPQIADEAPNKVRVTEDMLDGAQLLVDDVFATLKQHNIARTPENIALYVHVEEPIAVPRVHARQWGTPDVWVAVQLSPGTYRIYLWDFKYGHREVGAFENWQSVSYNAGIMTKLGLDDVDTNVSLMTRIVQPRNYRGNGIDEWRTDGGALRAYINVVANAAAEALGDNPKLRPGPECRDCRARFACPALTQTAHAIMDTTGSATPFGLPPAAVGWELLYVRRAHELLTAYLTGIEEQALSMMRRGERVPGVILDQGQGREVWKVPDASVITLGQMLGINVAKPPKAMTPNQALKAGMAPGAMAGLTHRPPGEMRITIDDGKLLRRAFGK